MSGKRLIVLCTQVMFAGCASIMSPSEYSLTVTSNVRNAKVTIYNRDKEVESVTTPTTVRLSPKAGFYVPARYRFVFAKDGYTDDEVALDADFNWWFVGNFITWGFVIGVFWDPATGAMWKLNETSVVGSLKPLSPLGERVEEPEQDKVPGWIFQGGGTDRKDKTEKTGESAVSVEIDQIPL